MPIHVYCNQNHQLWNTTVLNAVRSIKGEEVELLPMK